MDETKQTLIEEGTEFDGKLRSECPIVLSGKVKGELTAPTLLVTSTGSVQGQVKVSQLNSQGAIAGEIDAGSVELSGHVSDQTVIRANTLEVKLDHANHGVQVTFDSCELHVGQNVAAEKPKDAPKQPAKAAAKPAEAKAAAVKSAEVKPAAAKPSVPEKITAEDAESNDVVAHAVDLMLNK